MIPAAEIVARFGVDPTAVGNRPRGWWVVDDVGAEEEQAGAQVGYLCVKTRDGGSNPVCAASLKIPNCIGSAQDSFDCTYRYYYFSPRELLSVGTRVEKRSGYKWPGVIVASFATTAGHVRYVVECTVPEVAGALHIYSPDQIEPA